MNRSQVRYRKPHTERVNVTFSFCKINGKLNGIVRIDSSKSNGSLNTKIVEKLKVVSLKNVRVSSL
jgi:hypothetical protein